MGSGRFDLISTTHAPELDDEPMRFAPIGPDVYGRTQPQSLLTSIDEDAEPLLDLVDQHVVSINLFDPKPCFSCFGWPRNTKATPGDTSPTASRCGARS